MLRNKLFNKIVDKQTLETYLEFSYLTKGDIRRIVHLLHSVNPGKLVQNRQHRFTLTEIDKILPQIQCSPFRESVYHVFSSQNDNRLSLEDVLDLCSAFSENCPVEVQASWAFQIFDFDGNGLIELHDLEEAVKKLTWNCNDVNINKRDITHVAEMVLNEMVFNPRGTISSEEFIRFISRLSDFPVTFIFKI